MLFNLYNHTAKTACFTVKKAFFSTFFLKAKIFFPAKKVMLHYGLTLFKVIISYVVSIFIIVYLFISSQKRA
ncbi:hypothetical protein DXC97_00810 [Lachnospiraceae bacterium TF09-5]|nr:hypothetical protein DXC97_00810 [Lachnospiraceae bacterium TF09-5]